MDELTAFNQCLAWLTHTTALPEHLDGLVLCGNSLPATATAAGQLAQDYQLPLLIIAGGIGHACPRVSPHRLAPRSTRTRPVTRAADYPNVLSQLAQCQLYSLCAGDLAIKPATTNALYAKHNSSWLATRLFY